MLRAMHLLVWRLIRAHSNLAEAKQLSDISRGSSLENAAMQEAAAHERVSANLKAYIGESLQPRALWRCKENELHYGVAAAAECTQQ